MEGIHDARAINKGDGIGSMKLIRFRDRRPDYPTSLPTRLGCGKLSHSPHKPPALKSRTMNSDPLTNIPTPVMPEKDARQNLRWLFVLRNLMIAGESIVIWISIYGLSIPLREVPLWAIVTALGAFNWWTWLRLSSPEPIAEQELFIQLSFDVLAITAILYFTGGATNPIAWFFLLPLIIAATVLPQFYTWYMVIFTSGCYTILIGFYEPLPSIQPVTLPTDVAPAFIHALRQEHGIELHVFGMWFGFVFSAVLVAYFVVEMANTLRERERRLAEAREQTLRNERVVALGTLAAGAAHEMGTPLGTMAILIHEIENECQDGKPVDLQQKMKILREQVDRCKKALSVMSASAGEIRAEEGHIMSLSEYLDATVDSWRLQRLQPILDYRKTGPEPSPGILAEHTLTHALVNILNNAADVSPGGIELLARWNQDNVNLLINDSGPGIAPTISKRLGKAPITTKEQGLGVGLFLAFTTIERLGGSIGMRPRDQGGTCTEITLPLVMNNP
jgi:two-component system sensor histidine kinase RegB